MRKDGHFDCSTKYPTIYDVVVFCVDRPEHNYHTNITTMVVPFAPPMVS